MMEDNEKMMGNEIPEQEMQDVAGGGGLHCGDGRLIVTPAYHCNDYTGRDGHYGSPSCPKCKYFDHSGAWMVCDHPSHRR